MQANLSIDSAGTGDWHVGEPADPRMQEACRARGYVLTSRARQVQDSDFAAFDHILAMDRQNQRDLLARCPAEHRSKIRLFRELDPEPDSLDVPDPYHGARENFEVVVDIVERSCERLLDELETSRR